jgi:hypothetical protein
MSTVRSGTIINIEVSFEREDAVVHKLTLDTNPEEELTVCMPNNLVDETPVLNQKVLIFLHPADSEHPKHASKCIRDIPERVAYTPRS